MGLTLTTTAGAADVERLFEEHASGLFRLARLMLRSEDEAEDVVQETFLKLTTHVDAGRPLPNARGWLYTVAAHACRDRQRARMRWLPWLAERDRRTSIERDPGGCADHKLRVGLERLSLSTPSELVGAKQDVDCLGFDLECSHD